ncbi:MAG: hypothetical protein ACLQVD_10535 [Capsulimonadaceae bacterium]
MNNTDVYEQVPDAPNALRRLEHLVELLEEGMRSPTSPLTASDWNDLRGEGRDRSANHRDIPTIIPDIANKRSWSVQAQFRLMERFHSRRLSVSSHDLRNRLDRLDGKEEYRRIR